MRLNEKKKKHASLFVGRWQPFHAGHQALVETVLRKKKPVVIAIRDTEISHKNPYTVAERWTFIQRALRKYGELVKIITIPDIDEICYGRDVGYGIRRIELGKRLQEISGTKVRIKNSPTKDVIWLTGQSGSGKSTLALALQKRIGSIILDGDDMRESISLDVGFSKRDRDAHNMRVARLALALAKQSPVIVSVIAPLASTRQKIDDLIRPFWVYVKRKDAVRGVRYPYEIPGSPHLIADMDRGTPDEYARRIVSLMR